MTLDSFYGNPAKNPAMVKRLEISIWFIISGGDSN